MPAQERPATIDTLRMPKQKVDELLKKAEDAAKTAEPPAPEAGTPKRLLGARGVVSIAQMGSEATYAVPMREISDKGMAFLHRSMLHPNTPCTLHLSLSDGERIDVAGKVAGVRHVEGMIHDIRVAFDRPIDLSGLRAA